jgi:hypothetical protein
MRIRVWRPARLTSTGSASLKIRLFPWIALPALEQERWNSGAWVRRGSACTLAVFRHAGWGDRATGTATAREKRDAGKGLETTMEGSCPDDEGTAGASSNRYGFLSGLESVSGPFSGDRSSA